MGDKHDGMQSALIAMMNGGLSGFTKCHADIGGFTTFDIPGLRRTSDLLKKWIEQSAFADTIMRTHPSINPGSSAQVYDSKEMADFFGRFATIHKVLADYKYQLSEEATNLGTPMQRPLFLHFPHD